MFICNSCGHIFEEHKYIKNGGGDIGEDWPVCPECWNDDWEIARKCELCESIKSDADMCIHVDVCVECMKKVVKTAKDILQFSLPQTDYKAFTEYFDLDDSII